MPFGGPALAGLAKVRGAASPNRDGGGQIMQKYGVVSLPIAAWREPLLCVLGEEGELLTGLPGKPGCAGKPIARALSRAPIYLIGSHMLNLLAEAHTVNHNNPSPVESVSCGLMCNLGGEAKTAPEAPEFSRVS